MFRYISYENPVVRRLFRETNVYHKGVHVYEVCSHISEQYLPQEFTSYVNRANLYSNIRIPYGNASQRASLSEYIKTNFAYARNYTDYSTTAYPRVLPNSSLKALYLSKHRFHRQLNSNFAACILHYVFSSGTKSFRLFTLSSV